MSKPMRTNLLLLAALLAAMLTGCANHKIVFVPSHVDTELMYEHVNCVTQVVVTSTFVRGE